VDFSLVANNRPGGGAIDPTSDHFQIGVLSETAAAKCNRI
jgi:hypothetical protein